MNSSGISFQGVGSGLPVQQMMDAILKVRQLPIDKATKQLKTYDTKISDYGKLSNLLSTFKGTLEPFRVLKTAFKEQYSVQNSNEDLLTVTKKAGYEHKDSTSVFKLLSITNPNAQQKWTWASQKVIADYHYSGTMTMAGSTVDFTDKTGGYTLDEIIEKINNTTGLKDKVVAKKVLVNEHTDPTKNTYSLRLESKTGGSAGALNNPVFTINTITNPNSTGGTTGAGGTAGTGGGTTNAVNITGGAHIVASQALNSHEPSFIVDLTNYTNETHLTIFYDKNNDGNITDNAFDAGDEKEVFTKAASAGVAAFAGTYGNLKVEDAGNNRLRVTRINLTDQQLIDYKTATAPKPNVWIGNRPTQNNNGFTGGFYYTTHRPVTDEKILDYSDPSTNPINNQTQPVAANMIQPNLRDQWRSSGVAIGATMTEDTDLNVNGTVFNLQNKTLTQVANEINASGLSANLRADVIQDNGEQKLAITSKQVGSNNYMNIQVTNNTGNTNPPPPPPSNPVNDLVQNAQASITSNLDAKDLQIRFSVNGQVYTRNSYDLDTSKIAGLEGVEVKVKANAGNVTNKDATIVTTKDAAETKKHTKAAVQKFVDAYNAVVEFVNSQTQVEVKTDGRYAGALQSDSTLKSILQSLDSEIAKATGGDLKQSLAMMGIMHVNPSSYSETKDKDGKPIKVAYKFGSVNLNAGKLEIKDDLFTKALNSGSLEKTFGGYKDANGNEVEGYAERFNKLTKWMLTGYGSSSNFRGLIDMRKQTLENQKRTLSDKIDNMKLNLRDFQERLVKQFNFADSIAAKMNQINATLAKQLGNSSLISSALGGKK